MSSWRRSGFVAILVTSVFLVVQLAIPISRFGDVERGPRFGWHMFSGTSGAPEFVVETVDGEQMVVLEDYTARIRADIDIAGFLPSHLCDVIPGAVVVSWDEAAHRC